MNNEAITPEHLRNTGTLPDMEAAAHKETRDFLEWLWANCRILKNDDTTKGFTTIYDHNASIGEDWRREIEGIYEKSL